MDLLVERPVQDLETSCSAALPDGLRVLDSASLADGVPKLSADVEAARYEVAADEADLFDEKNKTWTQFLSQAREKEPAAGQSRKALMKALESDCRSRFAEGRREGASIEKPKGGAAAPSLLDITLYDKDGEIHLEYLSTMHGGKSLFPEDLLMPYFGDPAAFDRPVKVTRTALYVKRGRDYLSPISKGVVQRQA
jgi:hypothetical protein